MLVDLATTVGRIHMHISGNGMSTAAPKRRVRLHADKLNELLGPEFVQTANMGSGAGLSITGYRQTAQDIEVKVGLRARAERMAGNLNSLVMLRVKNRETAERLTNQLEEVRVATKVAASGVTDTNDPTDPADFRRATRTGWPPRKCQCSTRPG